VDVKGKCYKTVDVYISTGTATVINPCADNAKKPLNKGKKKIFFKNRKLLLTNKPIKILWYKT
jgi:hypothetical protein